MQRYAYFLNVQIFLEKFCFAHGWPAAKTHSLVYDDRGGVGSGTKNGSLVYATRLVNSPVSRLGEQSGVEVGEPFSAEAALRSVHMHLALDTLPAHPLALH